MKTEIPPEQIENLVERTLARVEARHGKKFTRSVRRVLDRFIVIAMTEALGADISPGRLIGVFVAVMRQIDRGSDEIVLGVLGDADPTGDIGKN